MNLAIDASSGHFWTSLRGSFQDGHVVFVGVVLVRGRVRCADEDDARHGISQALVIMQLGVSNAKRLLQDKASKTVADAEDRPHCILWNVENIELTFYI